VSVMFSLRLMAVPCLRNWFLKQNMYCKCAFFLYVWSWNCAVLMDSPPGTWTFWEPGLHICHANQFSFLPLYPYWALDNISCTWIFIPLSDLDSDISVTNSVWACRAKFCFGIDLVTSRGSWLCLVICGYIPFVGVAGSYCRVVFLNSQYSLVCWFCVLYFTCCYVCFVIVNCYVTYFNVCVNLHLSFHIWGCKIHIRMWQFIL
jgi:hypothetical protein